MLFLHSLFWHHYCYLSLHPNKASSWNSHLNWSSCPSFTCLINLPLNLAVIFHSKCLVDPHHTVTDTLSLWWHLSHLKYLMSVPVPSPHHLRILLRISPTTTSSTDYVVLVLASDCSWHLLPWNFFYTSPCSWSRLKLSVGRMMSQSLG